MRNAEVDGPVPLFMVRMLIRLIHNDSEGEITDMLIGSFSSFPKIQGSNRLKISYQLLLEKSEIAMERVKCFIQIYLYRGSKNNRSKLCADRLGLC